jgi:hypothetical protein
MAKKTTEVRLLPPRRVQLTAAQYDEAVSLLAELLLDAAAKRREGRSGGVIGGAIGRVIPMPEERRKGREAA